MRLVVVESPYAGDVSRNVAYARAALADCLSRGEAPFASHLLFTQPGVLDDTVPEERALGIAAGFAWAEHADAVVVYEDLGISRGMLAGIERAEKRGQPVERRSLPGWSATSRKPNMKLYWLDVETSGLSPERDVLLELAIAEADLERPFNIGAPKSWVFRLASTDGLSPFILDMHTKSRLLTECAQSTTTLAEVEEQLLAMVPEVTDREQTPTLAGSSVHFDHGFLRVHMPKFAARFSHRHYDVSAVKLFCRSLGMKKVPKAEAHRAVADILESIEHAKACAEWLAM